MEPKAPVSPVALLWPALHVLLVCCAISSILGAIFRFRPSSISLPAKNGSSLFPLPVSVLALTRFKLKKYCLATLLTLLLASAETAAAHTAHCTPFSPS